MFKAIIFDYFGVIGKKDVYASWLGAHGFKREKEFLRIAQEADSGMINLNSYFDRLHSISNEPVQKIREEFDDYVAIDQEVVAIIRKLQGKYKIGLLSNASAEYLRPILKQYDLEKYFDEIIISSDVGITKSDTRIFDLILGRLNMAPAETLFIDDLEPHIKTAEGIGIQGIRFLNSEDLTNKLQDYGIDNL